MATSELLRSLERTDGLVGTAAHALHGFHLRTIAVDVALVVVTGVLCVGESRTVAAGSDSAATAVVLTL